MPPSSSETPSMELPPPVVEQAPVVAGNSEKPAAAAAEQAPAGAENAPKAQQTAPAAFPSIPLPQAGTPTTSATTDVTSTTPAPTLPNIDDNDLIEKEWVNKAKAIVERTRDDPYKQSEELTVFKADYMKKHYDKTLKLSK